MLGQVSMHFNSIDYTFANQYIHKYQYGRKWLGKNEQGIIPNEGQHKRTTDVGFDESILSSSSSTPII